MIALYVSEEVVLLEIKFVTHKALKGLPIVRCGKMKLQLGGWPKQDMALPATLEKEKENLAKRNLQYVLISSYNHKVHSYMFLRIV